MREEKRIFVIVVVIKINLGIIVISMGKFWKIRRIDVSCFIFRNVFKSLS